MKAILTAIPGCGKTTIINYVKEYAAEKNIEISFANFGDYMFEISKEMNLVENRDEMRTKISKENYEEIQQKAAERIGALEGNVIIDTHASIKRKEGYYPGLPEKIVRALNPDVILLVEKNPEMIANQRSGDESRGTRDKETAEELETHQMLNRSFASTCAVITKSSVNVINERMPEEELEKGDFGHAKDAAEKIVELFE